MHHNKLIFVICILMLTSCSVLSPLPSSQMHTYLLESIPKKIPHKPNHKMTLLVMPPTTRSIYDTNQIAYTSHRFQISYFSQNQWAETPAQMFLPLLIHTLQKTKYFRTVVTQPYVNKYDYSLHTQILKFQLNTISNPNKMNLSIQVQLSRYSNQQIIATQLFSVNVPITQPLPYGAIVAANQTTAIMLRKISEFCLLHLK